jgi:hypothetical protein
MPKTQTEPGAQQIASIEFLVRILVDWRRKDRKAIAKDDRRAGIAEYRARNVLRSVADSVDNAGCQP